MASASIDSLVAIAPDDVWAIVRPDFTRTLVQHFDGVAWTTSFERHRPGPNRSWPWAPRRPTTSGWSGRCRPRMETRGYLNHYDGQTWQRAPDAPSPLLNVRHAPGVGTIAVGREGTILQLAATPVPGFTDLRTGSMQDAGGRVRQRAGRHVGGRRRGDRVALRWARGQRGGGADQRQPAGRVGQRPERRLDRRQGRHGAALRRAIIHAHRVGHDRGLAGGVHRAP